MRQPHKNLNYLVIFKNRMIFLIFGQTLLDPVVGIQDRTDGGIMVKVIDQESDIFGYIAAYIPVAGKEFRILVSTVSGDHLIDRAVCISLVKGSQAIGYLFVSG